MWLALGSGIVNRMGRQWLEWEILHRKIFVLKIGKSKAYLKAYKKEPV